MTSPFKGAGDALVNVMTALMTDLYSRVGAVEVRHRELEIQMTSAQEKIDSAVTAIVEASGNVTTELAALKAAVAAGETPLDFTALDAAVAGLNASTDTVESGEAVAPVDPPVDPAEPVEQPPVEPVEPPVEP
jgi:hypothetical protein